MDQALIQGLVEDWPAKPDDDLEEELRSTPPSLLNWLLVRTLNDQKIPSKARRWIDESLREAKQARKGDLVLWRLLRWASLCASDQLLDETGEKAAQEAIDWIVPASKKTKEAGDRAELVACTIGLLNYFEEDDALTAWRDKQLKQDWLEGSEESLFQSLYLAEPGTAEEDVELLSAETAHACATVIDNLPGRYTAGLVLALVPHAGRKDLSAGQALRAGARKVLALDPITVDGPRFTLETRDDKPSLVMTLNVGGTGTILPLSFLFPQLTGGFLRHFRDFLTKVADGPATPALGKKAVLAAIKDADATFTAVVRFDGRKLDLPKASKQGLERRFALAVAHARAFESKFAAKAKLRFEDATG